MMRPGFDVLSTVPKADLKGARKSVSDAGHTRIGSWPVEDVPKLNECGQFKVDTNRFDVAWPFRLAAYPDAYIIASRRFRNG